MKDFFSLECLGRKTWVRSIHGNIWYILQAPPPNTVLSRVRVFTRDFRRDTNVLSVTVLLSLFIDKAI